MTVGADGERWKARREASILPLSLLEFPISNRRGGAGCALAFERLPSRTEPVWKTRTAPVKHNRVCNRPVRAD